MSRKFLIPTKPYEEERLFLHRSVTIDPGVTVLVGCNGSGKTTMLTLIRDRLQQMHIPYLSYDNLFDGGHNALEAYSYYDQMDLFMGSLSSSEGENIRMNLGQFAGHVRPSIKSAKADGQSEFWVLLDAIDSGFSIDNIIELDDLFSLMCDDAKTTFGITLYIIAAANEFELVRRGRPFDLWTGKYIQLNDYDSYYDFIMKSADRKQARLEKIQSEHPDDLSSVEAQTVDPAASRSSLWDNVSDHFTDGSQDEDTSDAALPGRMEEFSDSDSSWDVQGLSLNDPMHFHFS